MTSFASGSRTLRLFNLSCLFLEGCKTYPCSLTIAAVSLKTRSVGAMFGENFVSAMFIFGVTTALVVGFSFPALTTQDGSGTSQEIAEEVTSKERSHCEVFNNGEDCACYAQTAGYIMSHEQPKIQGFQYADRKDLARNQAASNC